MILQNLATRNFFKNKNKKNLKIYDCYLIKIKKNGFKYSLIYLKKIIKLLILMPTK